MIIVTAKAPFQATLHITGYCCIPSKFPSERCGTHSYSLSEIQNIILVVASKPTK